MKVMCAECGKIIERKPSYLKCVKEISCSKECFRKIASKRMKTHKSLNLKDLTIYRTYIWTIENKYNLSESELRKMMDDQHGCCKICNNTLIDIEYKRQSMHIDHSHKSGKIRGLLCGHCNVFLGRSMDNVQILKNAILYLEEENND